MNCQDYRDQLTVHLAEGSAMPGDHGESCLDCGRYLELARATWEAAGKDPDWPVPEGLSLPLLQQGRRPRGATFTLLRPGLFAAAAVLLVLGAVLVWAARPGPGTSPMMDADGMSVERYELPPGANAALVAEELRKTVAPESWAEGASGLEVGAGFLRVRATGDVQKAVRDFLARRP